LNSLNISFRIDPTLNQKGIHIVDVENGGQSVFIPNNEINNLIRELKKVSTRSKGVGLLDEE
jgi:hypothetical protein